jgi:hypothetical protein
VARATRRGADSSVSLGAPRQRHVRHETRCRPGGEPALCAPARAPVLLRDLHLAHHRQRPAGHRRACRSPTWGSPTRRLLEALLPSISTSVLRALQRAQQLPAKLRNRPGSSRFRLPGHCSNRVPGHNCKWPQLITPRARWSPARRQKVKAVMGATRVPSAGAGLRNPHGVVAVSECVQSVVAIEDQDQRQ